MELWWSFSVKSVMELQSTGKNINNRKSVLKEVFEKYRVECHCEKFYKLFDNTWFCEKQILYFSYGYNGYNGKFSKEKNKLSEKKVFTYCSMKFWN